MAIVDITTVVLKITFDEKEDVFKAQFLTEKVSVHFLARDVPTLCYGAGDVLLQYLKKMAKEK